MSVAKTLLKHVWALVMEHGYGQGVALWKSLRRVL